MKDRINEIARERADWLVDAVATATQDRRLLRADPEEDKVLTEALFLNAEKAIREAIRRSDNPAVGSRWRHSNGTEYTILGVSPFWDMVIYAPGPGTSWWWRPVSEFLDGRFDQTRPVSDFDPGSLGIRRG